VHSLSGIESAVIRYTRMIAIIGLAGLVVLSFVIVIQVLSRWLLNTPLLGVYDFTSLATRISVASCLPLVYAERRNIGVRLVGKIHERAGRLLDGLANLVAVAVFSVTFWHLIEYIKNLIATKESTVTVNLIIAPWMCIAAGLFLLCIPIQLFCFYVDIHSVVTWKRDRNDDIKAGAEAKEERGDLL